MEEILESEKERRKQINLCHRQMILREIRIKIKGDKDKNGVVQNIHVVSEKIRPQTKVEKEQSVIR